MSAFTDKYDNYRGGGGGGGGDGHRRGGSGGYSDNGGSRSASSGGGYSDSASPSRAGTGSGTTRLADPKAVYMVCCCKAFARKWDTFFRIYSLCFLTSKSPAMVNILLMHLN